MKAILILGDHTTNGASSFTGAAGCLGEVPVAFLDVLGRPVLRRMIERIQAGGARSVALLGEYGVSAEAQAQLAIPESVTLHRVSDAQRWQTAESVFVDYAQSGTDLVLVMEAGAYLELNLEEFVQFHLDSRSRVSAAVDENGAHLGAYLVSASRRNDAAYLFRHQLKEFRTACVPYRFNGYVNRLKTAGDFRRLAIDGLMMKCQVTPEGKEVRPGIWTADAAQIHRRARVLAPAFIGAHSKVRAAAVITRGTTLEHHSVVDCGTVVEDASVLPHTYIGAGLDVTHSVVGLQRLAHLQRNVEVEITDTKLIGQTSRYAPLRVLGSAAALAGFLPKQIFRALLASSQREMETDVAAAIQSPSAALKQPSSLSDTPDNGESEQFPANLAVVARRYGDQ